MILRYLGIVVVLTAALAVLLVVNNKSEKQQSLEKKAESKIVEESRLLPQATSSLPEKVVAVKPKIEFPPIVLPQPILPKEEIIPAPPVFVLPPTLPLVVPPPAAPPPTLPSLPPLDEKALLKAVVKIQCPTQDGLGKYIGSGFVVKGNVVITAAHVIMDSASRDCDIIFSRERRPIHYLRGTAENLREVRRRHDEEGIDVAFIRLPPIESYPEAGQIFSEYPSLPYPICGNPLMLGDKLLHFGYPSNYLDQTYLSELEGLALTYADIKGIREQLSEDKTYAYKSPIFGFTNDESALHPYMLSRVPSFYGDSGGLAFNAAKQCVLGPHRGGTIGRGAGENYSVFMMLGWEKVINLIPSQ